MRKALLFILPLFLVATVLPSFDKQQAYQDFLWTARRDWWQAGGWQYDNAVEVTGIAEWDRLRLGFPLKATTLDRRSEEGAWQMRIEDRCLYLNLIMWALGSAIIRFAMRHGGRFAGSHPEPDKF